MSDWPASTPQTRPGDALLHCNAVVPTCFESIRQAASLLRQGQVVAYPTETNYGLAVDALNPRAVQRLVEVKGRGPRHPMALIVGDPVMLRSVVASVPRPMAALMRDHWPGPLTLVLPAVPQLSLALVNEQHQVGVRISSDPVAQQLVSLLGRPISATSANLTGQPGATTAVAACVPGVALVLDDGPRCGQPSTVVGFDRTPVVLRAGAITL